MEPQPIQSKPLTTPSPFRSCSGRSNFRGFSKRRILLFLLAIIVLALMVIGIVFAAHRYYIQFGGQGWLKKRTLKMGVPEPILPHLYLPMRQVESIAEVAVSWGLAERTPGNVPFYTCGDQQESCEEFSQPVSHLNTTCMPQSLTITQGHLLPSRHVLFCCLLYEFRHLLLQHHFVNIQLSSLSGRSTRMHDRNCAVLR